MSKLAGNSEVDVLVRGFVDLGWIVDRRKRHLIVWNPADHDDRLTISHGSRPAGYEVLKRLKSRLKRAREAKAVT